MNKPDKSAKVYPHNPPPGTVVHKYQRGVHCDHDVIRCMELRQEGHVDLADKLFYRVYQWAKVTCPDCLALRGKRFPNLTPPSPPLSEEEKLCTVTEVVADLMRPQFPIPAEMLDRGGVMGLDPTLTGSVSGVEKGIMGYLNEVLDELELFEHEFMALHATHLVMLYLGVWLGQIGAAHLRTEPGGPNGT